tara:strand:+ start:71420 stop:71701 length:282 start_codon:yes stop_codon:yes gene_type:complete
MKTITSEEFVAMQQTAKTLIECIFQEEESFKASIIQGNWGWTREPYELERVHLSGWRLRVTVKFLEDYSETDIYLCLNDVYNWYEKLCEEKGL